jgi:hypothetical protein
VIDSVQQAEVAILRYLIANQNARDTIEGIEKWWLPQARQYGIGDVVEALHELQSRNLIRVWESASAKPVYGCGSQDSRSLEAHIRKLSEP